VSAAGSAPLAPEGLATDLRERHARITASVSELGASCLVAIRDQSITYLTGYTTMTWKMYSRPVVAVLAADGRWRKGPWTRRSPRAPSVKRREDWGLSWPPR
jgi:hypothetical protein